jgi:hypothetical protein
MALAKQNVGLVKIQLSVFNLDALAGCHWEKDKLFVHFIGGRFEQLVGDKADLLWEAIVGRAADLVVKN